jgi:type III restriction enzyme
LDVKNLNFQPVSEEILIKKLREQENNMVTIIGKGGITPDSYERMIVNELINYPEIHYDDASDLLFKLAGQAVKKFQTYLNEEEVTNVVQYNKREIGKYIHSQMMEHFYFEQPQYLEPKVYPFDRIIDHNYSKICEDKIYDFRETVTPTNTIPSKLFTGFKKSCHPHYKFDSKTEKDLAIILEDNTKNVKKWLRPSQEQLHIYWKHNSKRYCPDFIVEAKTCIYMIETKKEMDLESQEVQEKAMAALKYCEAASKYTKTVGGKAWKYVLIPHNEVMQNMSFENLVKKYEFKHD